MQKFHEQESSTLEFKEKLPEINKLLRVVIAFCNQFGGKIIIGIRDDGAVAGLTDEQVTHALEVLPNSIYQDCIPHVLAHVYPMSYGDKTVVVVDISEGMQKPYFVKSLGKSAGTLVRLGRSNVHATSAMIQDLEWQARGRSADERPIYQASEMHVDLKSFQKFLKSRSFKSSAAKSSSELMRSYRIFYEEQGQKFPTLAGLLLFGTDTQFFLPEAYVSCARFAGRSGRDATSSRIAKGTLFEQINTCLSFVIEHTPREFTVRGKKRIETPLIPEIALRESLLNLLVHRDYGISAPAKISIFENRIEIFSPGVFPGPLSQHNLEAGITYIRNNYIAKVFFEAGLIEKLGSGFRTIFATCDAAKLRRPDVLEGEGFVKVIFHFEKVGHQESGVEHDWRILERLFALKPEITTADMIANEGISRATAGRIFLKFVSEKRIRRKGRGPTTRYSKV